MKPPQHPFSRAVPAIVALLVVAAPLTGAGPSKIGHPDFTQGDPIPESAIHDWNLGASGARGWMFSDKMVTSDARQIRITKVQWNSPASGVLAVGDVILRVAGKRCGRARGSVGSVYRNLSYDEIKPLLPAIHQAIAKPAPSGIMFADGIRTSGLEPFSKHRISEGIELLVAYARNQKKHGSQKRIGKVMEMLEADGTHGKRVIPQLQETANYFENEETDFPHKMSLDKARIVRETIRNIEASNESPKLIHLSTP